jgi:hypothetical protein
MAAPTVLGVADSYGIELIHPMREGRSPAQIGKKGKSNHRWIVGGKLCFILNQWGLICAWDCATANVHDTHFQSGDSSELAPRLPCKGKSVRNRGVSQTMPFLVIPRSLLRGGFIRPKLL